MYITTFYDGVAIHRAGKIIYGRFLEPHLVLSTCRVAGGMRRGLGYVLNHQSCEPCNHGRRLALRDPERYRREICAPHGLPPEQCATMGTAANMHHAAFVRESFQDLEVGAVITGGVETNAGRAGDPASVHETADGFIRLDRPQAAAEEPAPGTINIMLFIGQPLTEAALTRSIITATEAKTAALQELAVNSRYSDGLATGTGTDQVIVAAPDRDGFRLGWAGKHSKLGELIGRVVLAGVKEALAKQNRLTPMGQCSARIHLERFGCSRQSLRQGIADHLEGETAEVLKENIDVIIRDPLVVAAVAAMVHLRDKIAWGILPSSCRQDIMAAAAAQLACALSGRYDLAASYRDALAGAASHADNRRFLALCHRAMALGFADKWADGT